MSAHPKPQLLLLAGIAASLAGCHCADLPGDALFPCENASTCAPGFACIDGFCRLLDGGTPNRLDASAPGGDAGLPGDDAAVESDAALSDASSAPGEDAGSPPDAAMPADAGTPGPDAALAGEDAAWPDDAAIPSDAGIVIIAPDASISICAMGYVLCHGQCVLGTCCLDTDCKNIPPSDCHQNNCRPCGALGQPCCGVGTCSRGRCAAGFCGTDTPGLFFPDGSAQLFTDLMGSISLDFSFTASPGNFAGAAAGDWYGQGIDTLAPYNDGAASIFYVSDANKSGAVLKIEYFGLKAITYLPISGKWQASESTSSPGIYDPAAHTFWLDPDASTAFAQFDFTVTDAPTKAQPIAGDWTHQGYDTVGLYDPVSATFYQWDYHPSKGTAVSLSTASRHFTFGAVDSGAFAVAGDWDGNGLDTIGLIAPDANCAGSWRIELLNANAASQYADVSFCIEPREAFPFFAIAGRWQ